MADLPQRLRAYAKDQGGWLNIDETCEEAADEIERLRKALRFYDCGGNCKNCYGPVQDTQHCGLTAHRALATVKEAGDEQ